MNLKELKGMIAEEYSRYLKEQEDVAVDVNPDVEILREYSETSMIC